MHVDHTKVVLLEKREDGVKVYEDAKGNHYYEDMRLSTPLHSRGNVYACHPRFLGVGNDLSHFKLEVNLQVEQNIKDLD